MYNKTSISKYYGFDYYRTYKDEEKKNQSSLVDDVMITEILSQW